MMRAIALRLEGPLQSWGGPVAGDTRTSLDLPTKSGIVGLLGACLGVARRDVAPLVALHATLALGVRVDRRGTPGIDFQTVLRVEGGNPTLTPRHYLYDASFAALLVERAPDPSLEAPARAVLPHPEAAAPAPEVVVRQATLEALLHALRYPRYAPCLGRRACVPSVPVLARDEVLVADDWPGLFAQVPRADRGEGRDVFLEGEHDGGVRQFRVRDELVGPLPRLFYERVVTHLRFSMPPPRPEAPPPTPTTDDTVTPWLS
jgi:CRISPR system Cascade subunit CasD